MTSASSFSCPTDQWDHSFSPPAEWSTQGNLGFSEGLHGNLKMWLPLLQLCNCGAKSCSVCKCLMWGILETALTLTERTTEEQWPTMRALPAGKAGVHAVHFMLAYVEARKTEASFPREQKYSIWNTNRFSVFFLNLNLFTSMKPKLHHSESVGPYWTSVTSFELCWLVVM